jgi:hypothetical protein
LIGQVGSTLVPIPDFLPDRHCAWLLRPLIDLGPFDKGPLYAHAVEHYWQALTTPALPRFALQRTLPPGFRSAMLRDAGRETCDVDDPRNLAPENRTERWQALCDYLDAWADHDDEVRCRLVVLLHGLSLHECVASLVPVPPARLDNAQPSAIEVAYWAESSRYMLRMPATFEQYRNADLSVFEAIAREAPHAQPAAFNAATKIFVHLAKTGADVDRLRPAAALMSRRLDEARTYLESFSADLLTSRFHRALSFLPMRRGDRDGVVREMDLAEGLARDLQGQTDAQRLLVAENLHPVLESRSKEALWLGDEALALARARDVIGLDRLDPKSWLELGNLHFGGERWREALDAFVTAAILGPPVGAIARHMAGVCARQMGLEVLGSFFFQGALEIDPFGISPRAELAGQPRLPELASLKAWSSQQFQSSN